jgi:hypothetical protein
MRKGIHLLTLAVFSLSLGLISCSPNHEHRADVSNITIVSPSDATSVECLAAKEVRRYVYLRTGKLLSIVRSSKALPPKTPLIIVGQKDHPAVRTITDKNPELASSTKSLHPQQYLIKTFVSRASSPRFEGETPSTRKVLLITGGDSIGTLYAAYRFAEHLGVRFYLHGDTIPDERIALKIPDLDERGKPLFDTRGIQPFHDFPEGPDWWNTDDYKAVIAQLPKLRISSDCILIPRAESVPSRPYGSACPKTSTKTEP